jgi:hypothetical protein
MQFTFVKLRIVIEKIMILFLDNQPLPSAPSRIKSSYSEDGQLSKRRLHHQKELFQSVSCRQLLESSRHTTQQRRSLRNSTVTHNMIDEKSPLVNSYGSIHKQKQIEVNKQLSNSIITEQINDQSSLTT